MPPVALAYAGSGIAGSDPMKTGSRLSSLRLQAGPYIYVYNPMLLFIDVVPLEMIQAIFTALLGVFLLAMATIGFYKAYLAWYMRIIALGGALGLLIPGTLTDLAGLAVLVLIYFIQTAKAKSIAKKKAE